MSTSGKNGIGEILKPNALHKRNLHIKTIPIPNRTHLLINDDRFSLESKSEGSIPGGADVRIVNVNIYSAAGC